MFAIPQLYPKFQHLHYYLLIAGLKKIVRPRTYLFSLANSATLSLVYGCHCSLRSGSIPSYNLQCMELKGSLTGHFVKVSLWYAFLLTNTRFRFLYVRISNC